MNLLQHILFLVKSLFLSFVLFSFAHHLIAAKGSTGNEIFELLKQNQISQAEERLATVHHKTNADTRKFNNALVQYYDGNYSRSIELLNTILFPEEFVQYPQLLSLSYWKSGDKRQAHMLLQDELNHRPEDTALQKLYLFMLYQEHEYEHGLKWLSGKTGFEKWQVLFLAAKGECAFEVDDSFLHQTVTSEKTLILLKACNGKWDELILLSKSYLVTQPTDTIVRYLYWLALEEQNSSTIYQKFNAYRSYTGLYGGAKAFSMQSLYLLDRFWIYLLLFIAVTVGFLIFRK